MGQKHKIVQIVVFPIIFVNDYLKKLKNLKCGILHLLVLNQIEGMQLPIKNLWNAKKQLKYLVKWDAIFIF